MTPAIKTEMLCKNYGSVQAVKNLNLEIGEGELFSLLGVNGAGKSTTIKMLTCLVNPSSGRAEILGEDIGRSSQKIKGLINVSPQESAVAGNLTVYENLAFISQIYAFSAKETAEKAEREIERFSLQEVRNRKAKTLSGGYARRLSIAMALITEPKVLFLDEPTLGLDVLSRRALWHIIEGLKGKITVVLTTHYMEEAEALSDRIGVMVNGGLAAIGSAEELKRLTDKESFEEAFISIASGEFCAKKAADLSSGGTDNEN